MKRMIHVGVKNIAADIKQMKSSFDKGKKKDKSSIVLSFGIVLE